MTRRTKTTTKNIEAMKKKRICTKGLPCLSATGNPFDDLSTFVSRLARHGAAQRRKVCGALCGLGR